MSIFDKKVPSPKKAKIGLRERIKGIGRGFKERVAKSPAAHTYKRVKQVKERPLFPNRPAERKYKEEDRKNKRVWAQYEQSQQQYKKDMARYNAAVLNKPPKPIEPIKPTSVWPKTLPKPLFKRTPQEIAAAEQAKHYPTKQIKKTILDAGYLVAHQDRPFSAIAKSAGFGGRGGGRGRSRRSSTSSRATPRAGLSSTKTSSYLGNEPVDPNDPYGF